MEDFHLMWPFMIPIVGTICTFAFLIVLTMNRSRIRELEIRERIAMVERGLVPPPEVDPRGFEREMDRHERRYSRRLARHDIRSGRHRRSGVTVMGVGAGLMVLIAFTAGEPGVAIGVGGAIMILGLAFFINGMMSHAEEPLTPRYPLPAGQPPVTPNPPSPVSDHRVD